MNTLATMMNETAVPRSKSVLRSTMPSATVTTQIVQPVTSSNGRRHARATIHPVARPMRNGAAIRSTSPKPEPSSWLRRPMATNTRMTAMSSAAAMRTRAPVTSPLAGESAERALEEQQGVRAVAVVVGIGFEGDDVAEDEEVVSHLVHTLDLAVDPRHRSIDDR